MDLFDSSAGVPPRVPTPTEESRSKVTLPDLSDVAFRKVGKTMQASRPEWLSHKKWRYSVLKKGKKMIKILGIIYNFLSDLVELISLNC